MSARALSTTSCRTVWASRLALIRKLAALSAAMRPLSASRSCFPGSSGLKGPSPAARPDLCGSERRSRRRRFGAGRALRMVTIVPSRHATHTGHNNYSLRHRMDTILSVRLGYVFVPLGYDCVVIQGAIKVWICVLMGGQFHEGHRALIRTPDHGGALDLPNRGIAVRSSLKGRPHGCNTNCDGDGP